MESRKQDEGASSLPRIQELRQAFLRNKGIRYEETCKIDRFRTETRILDLGILWFDSEKQKQLLTGAQEKAQAMAEEQERKLHGKEQSEKREQELLRILTDLKSRDASSLIETEKSRSRELSSLDGKLENLRQKVKTVTDQSEICGQTYNTVLTASADTLSEFAGKLAETLTIWPQLPLKAALDAIQHARLSETPHQALEMKPLRELGNAFGGAVERCRAAFEAAGECVAGAQKGHVEASEALNVLQKQSEAMPESLADYADFLNDLDRQMLPALPLYLKLHWKKSVAPAMRSAVEELIGEATLATIVTDSDYAERIRNLLLEEECLGFRLAELDSECAPQPPPRVYEFLERFFDSSKDAPYLAVLAREFDGNTVPELEDGEPVRFAQWRGSFRVFYGQCAKLIGEEERKAEQKRRIADAKEILLHKTSFLQQVKQQQSEAEKRWKALSRFEERFNQLFSKLVEQHTELENLNRLARELAAELAGIADAIQEMEQSRTELLRQLERLRNLVTRIVAKFGDTAVAGVAAAGRLEVVAFIFPMALGIALMPMIAQNYGARLYSRIHQCRRFAMRFALYLECGVAALYFLLAPWLVRFFTADPHVAAFMTAYLRIIPWGFGLMEIHRYSGFLFTGCGHPRATAWLAALRILALMIPLSLLALRWEWLNGIFWARLTTDLLAGAIGWYLVRRMTRALPADGEIIGGTQAS